MNLVPRPTQLPEAILGKTFISYEDEIFLLIDGSGKLGWCKGEGGMTEKKVRLIRVKRKEEKIDTLSIIHTT